MSHLPVQKPRNDQFVSSNEESYKLGLVSKQGSQSVMRPPKTNIVFDINSKKKDYREIKSSSQLSH